MRRTRWTRRTKKPSEPAMKLYKPAMKRMKSETHWRFCAARARTRRAGIRRSPPARGAAKSPTTHSTLPYTKTASCWRGEKPPPGRAVDDGGKPYVEEWESLRLDELPYGEPLSDDGFTNAISDMVAQGRNSRVRSYDCVFSVMVWDKTPDHAKKRWKDAHDRVIEGSFGAYTVKNDPWPGGEPKSGGSNRFGSRPPLGSG